MASRTPARRLVFSLGLATLLVGLVWRLSENKPKDPVPTSEPQISQPPEVLREETPPPQTLVLGDRLLAQYGAEGGSLAQDLEILHRFLNNVFILVKQRDPRHYATNEDLVEFLQGKRGQQEVFLSQESPALNENGQLIDRLGNPIHIHPLSAKRLEIRSAGPDGVPYTDDDLVK